MAKLGELSLFWQAFLRSYPFRRAHWTKPASVKPLGQSKVALITTAGLTLPTQPPFDPSIKGGDFSYRWIENTVSVQDLASSQRSKSFDRAGIQQDPNLCFPLDRFRELAAESVIGGLNHRHLSFMGSLTAPGRLARLTAPQAVEELRRDQVDLAFLVPV
ncbi:MAG: hypothetical protein HY648_07425 [Acidobacteria bacterium]|nr:hypothetical protein [Acidobacteriota bacterium]